MQVSRGLRYTVAMKKLPSKTKTGKLLVATAADGRVGLYCKGESRKESSKYLIINQRGKKMPTLMGSGGYPIAPNDLKWLWLDKQHKRKKKRRDDKQYVDPRAGRSEAKHKSKKSLKLSESLRCQECRKDMHQAPHAHTLSHPSKGYAQTFCCKCTHMMGYVCSVRKQERALELAKGLLGNRQSVWVVGSGDEYDERWRVEDEYDERWVAA